ncbi:hypothetical protein ACFW1A_40370 [Kitasatospora sp. NPDC058965]|uniref:hypothetical protein n=1 Tax=Kitasatospora sp. NPDC058965 TaxID=3346682 RepID=UPI0036853E03
MTGHGGARAVRGLRRRRAHALLRSTVVGALAAWSPTLLVAIPLQLLLSRLGFSSLLFHRMLAATRWSPLLGAVSGLVLLITFRRGAQRPDPEAWRELLGTAVTVAVLAQFVLLALSRRSSFPLLMVVPAAIPAVSVALLGAGWVVAPLTYPEARERRW